MNYLPTSLHLLLCAFNFNILYHGRHVSASSLEYNLNRDGSYEILANGKVWLYSAPTYFTSNGRTYSTADKSLKFKGYSRSVGKTKLGTFSSDGFEFEAGSTVVETSFTKYENLPNVVFLAQVYVSASSNTSVGDSNKILSAFPNFDISSPVPLGYLAFGGLFFGDEMKKIGRWTKQDFEIVSGTDGGPLVLFDNSSSALIMSPATNFMAMSPYHDASSGHYGWGIMGGVKQVPERFISAVVLYFSDAGIMHCFEGWGELLRSYYNKPTSYRDSDLTINYLSYWSDNGAYYVNYYQKPPYLIENKTYEQGLLDVVQYASKMGIPYRSIQYSVWFQQGHDSGDKQWDTNTKLFPDGMKYMFEKTGLLGTAHNRWWSKDTTYAKQNGGKFNFVIENIALPVDQSFWDYFFAHSKQLGFKTLMQDWLNFQFDAMDVTKETVDVARTWLLQMGRGAEKNDMTIQYCMSLSRHILQTLEIPTVTQGRASNDYQPEKEAQWQIGISSLFAHAMGLAPFKDTFWTTTNQPGNFYNASEPHPALHTLVSTLSGGPVGPGDMAGRTNVSLLMRCCRPDGLILKPSRPAFATSQQLLAHAFSGTYPGELWTTYSYIGHEFLFGIIFAADLRTKFSVTPNMVGHADRRPQMLYRFTYNPKSVQMPVAFTSPLLLGPECTMDSFCLYYTSPVFFVGSEAVVLLGELDKWIPISPQRVLDVNQTPASVLVTVAMAAEESLNFYFSFSSTIKSVHCYSEEGLSVMIDIRAGTCA